MRFLPATLPDRTTLFYVAYTLALFLLFVLLTFPHEVLARRAVRVLAQELSVDVDFESASFVPWSGLRLHQLRIFDEGSAAEPIFEARQASMRPTIASLFRGPLTLRFTGQAYRGSFQGTAGMGPSVALEADWEGLDLAAYTPLQRTVSGQWQGRLSGQVALVTDETNALEGSGKLDLAGASLEDGNAKGFRIPNLHFREGTVEFSVKGGRLEVGSLRLGGEEVDVEARGQVYLREPIGKSVVNAAITARTVPGADPSIEGLLALLKGNQRSPNGTYAFSLYGTLDRVQSR